MSVKSETTLRLQCDLSMDRINDLCKMYATLLIDKLIEYNIKYAPSEQKQYVAGKLVTSIGITKNLFELWGIQGILEFIDTYSYIDVITYDFLMSGVYTF